MRMQWIFLIAVILGVARQMQAIFPINYLRPYDEIFYRVTNGEKFELYAVAEHGFKAQGRSEEGNKVLPFQLWQCDQSSLAMLKGFDYNSEIGYISQRFNLDNDDGIRGHLIPHAKVAQTSTVISARYYLPYNLSFSVHVPLYSIEVSDVFWKDLTREVTSEDALVREELTGDITSLSCTLGGLNIGNWSDRSIGDIAFAVGWMKEYPQIKPLLRTVTMAARSGITLPTAHDIHRDQAFSIPFGNDGSTGIFFGGGIDLKWEYHLRAGIDVEFLYLFGSTQCRRIKTDPSQGDLLLLKKAFARRDFALTQRYNLFLELNRILQGFSLRATYQFWQHGQDSLSLLTNSYSSTVANTALMLEDWSMHQFIFSLFYDTAAQMADDASCKPQFTLYAKVPINGSHALLTYAFGGAVMFNF